jgi:ApbE family
MQQATAVQAEDARPAGGELLGYGRPHQPPAPGLLALRHPPTGTTLVTDHPVLIDVGAAGKGYLVDLIADTLRDTGIDRFVVDGRNGSPPPCPMR